MINKLFFLLLIIITIISCQGNVKNKIPESNQKKSDNLHNIFYEIPDTIKLNKTISASLDFRSPLDTITLIGNDEKYKLLYVCVDSVRKNSIADVRSSSFEVFTTDDNSNNISFYYSFKNKNQNYLSLFLKDTYIDKHTIIDTSRMIRHRVIISKEVVLVD